MKRLRENLYRNSYPERILSAPRNLARTTENDTRKLIILFLPFVKGPAKKLYPPYDTRTIFRRGTAIQKYLFRSKPLTEYNMSKNCLYSIPCSWGKVAKSKARETSKSSMSGWDRKAGILNHIWKENGNHLPWEDEVKIIDREEHWRVRKL